MHEHPSIKKPYDPSDHQYPQWVTIEGRKEPVLVQDESEHAELLGESPSDVLDKDALIGDAEKKCIKIDRRWSAEKIRDVIAAG